MRYKNIKTGAIIDSPFIVTGPDWEKVSSKNLKTKDLSRPELLQLIKEKDKKIEELQIKINGLENNLPKEQDEEVQEEIDLEEMSNRELEEFAKEHEVPLKADDKRNKANLIAAIVKAFEE